MKTSRLPVMALAACMLVATGAMGNPLDMTFAQFSKLTTAKRAKFFKSLSEEDQYNLKAAMLHYGLRDEKEKMNKKTIRELIAEGKEIRDRMREDMSE